MKFAAKTGKIILLVALVVLLALAAASLVQSSYGRRFVQDYPAPGVLIEMDGANMHLRCIGQGEPTVVMMAGSGAASVVSYEVQDRVSANCH